MGEEFGAMRALVKQAEERLADLAVIGERLDAAAALHRQATRDGAELAEWLKARRPRPRPGSLETVVGFVEELGRAFNRADWIDARLSEDGGGELVFRCDGLAPLLNLLAQIRVLQAMAAAAAPAELAGAMQLVD